MVRLFARHAVKDYATWRQAYDAFDATRKEMGVTGDAVFQTADNPNEVTVWHDFGTLDQAQAFAGSEALKSAMTEAGVAGPPTIWFVTEAN